MGAVLAMMRGWRKLMIAALALGLAGCGAGGNNLLAAAGSGLAKSILRIGGASSVANPIPTLTRDVFDGVTVPVIAIEIEAQGIGGTAAVIGRNGPVVTWAGADGAGIILRQDVVTATRGLGEDLLSADVAGVIAALGARGPGTLIRTHRYLDGEGREFERRFACTLSPEGAERITVVGVVHATRVVGEVCTADGTQFENRYWIGVSDQVIWRSRQWVGPAVGTLIVQHILR